MSKKAPLIFSTTLALITVHTSSAYALIAGGCGTGCANNIGFHEPKDFFPILINFLIYQSIITLIFYISGYIFGRRVEAGKLTANISRKFVCLTTFLASFTNSILMSNSSSNASHPIFIVLGLCALLMMLATLKENFRSRSPFLKTVFASINRPEDAPHTLKWLSTEAIATTTIILIFNIIIAEYIIRPGGLTSSALLSVIMLIPIFASGLGDAFAEIVGKKWGRYHYQTTALFTDKKYTRTIEGSATIFIITLMTGLLYAYLQSSPLPDFFWKAVYFLPVTLTIAEAKSPHTWDNPFLYLTGYLTILVCLI